MFDPNKQIYEYTSDGLTNRAYVENYILTQLNIASQFIQANNLFDLLTYEVKKLDDNDNYLFVMQPITLSDCLKWTKIYGIFLLSAVIIGGIFIYLNI